MEKSESCVISLAMTVRPLIFRSSIYSRVKQIHAFNTGKSGEDGYTEIALWSYSSQNLQMFVRMSESHCRFMERIFYIENGVIA